MKVGIYNPGLPALGGGEKYICELAIELSDDHDVEFIGFAPFDRASLESRFGFDLQNVGARVLRMPAGFVGLVPYLRGAMRHRSLSRASKAYDVFINQAPEKAPFPAYAATNIAHLQVGPPHSGRVRFTRVPFAKKVWDGTLASYDVVLANSQFTKRWVDRAYAREAVVLYPPCGAPSIKCPAKENIILSVGRFFIGGHCKKQLEMIKSFKRLYDSTPEAAQWTYHLVGGVRAEHAGVRYFDTCRAEAAGYPIVIHPNAPASVTEDLYTRASLFWHATGFGEDEALHPDRMESFGITTVEAMAAGSVPLVINKGGQPEIVRNGIEGTLWDTLHELLEGTASLMTDSTLRAAMSVASMERSKAFSTRVFKER
ncbi:MAG: glycosyltransferase family 4 protein, partial [Halobacteriota archaeon]